MLELASRCKESLFSADEEEAHAQAEAESHNLDAAWEWLAINDNEGMLQMVTWLNWYYILTGRWRLADERMIQALALADQEPRFLLVHAWLCQGNFVLLQAQHGAAEAWFRKVIEHSSGWNVMRGAALTQLSQLHAELEGMRLPWTKRTPPFLKCRRTEPRHGSGRHTPTLA